MRPLIAITLFILGFMAIYYAWIFVFTYLGWSA